MFINRIENTETNACQDLYTTDNNKHGAYYYAPITIFCMDFLFVCMHVNKMNEPIFYACIH